MLRYLIEETLAVVALGLFVGCVAIWAGVACYVF